MKTTNVMVAAALTEHCAMVDGDDELWGLHLSDEEILAAFFKDGCDLDGAPLLMATQAELDHAPANRLCTLH